MEVTGDEAGTIQWYEVPCEPADNVLSREHIDDVAARKVLTEFIEALHISGPMVSVNIVDRVNDALEAPEVPEPVKRLLREVMDYVG
jgi:hypothetical protein